jgi:hypothetical protein
VGDGQSTQGSGVAALPGVVGSARLFEGLFAGDGNKAVDLAVAVGNGIEVLLSDFFAGKVAGGEATKKIGNGMTGHGVEYS